MRSYARIHWFAVPALLGMLLTAPAVAQSPAISSLSPQAVQPGSTVDVTVGGSGLNGATQLWSSFGGPWPLTPEIKDNGTNAGKAVFRVTLPETVPVGIHGIRVVTDHGVSAARLIVIDDLNSVSSAGNNKTPSTAQVLETPIAVDGRIDSLSRNYFRFHAEAGQRVSIEVLARRLGSALDPMIRVLDESGRELVYSDDARGLSADAQLSYRFEKAGNYLVEVRDIRYQGGGTYFYRLRIGDFPCVTNPYPLGVTRGRPAAIEFAGQDIDELAAAEINVPADHSSAWITTGARRAGGSSSGIALLSVGDREEFLETEPNNTVETANPTSLASHFNGRFQEPDDVDSFRFSAKKGQKYSFAAITRSQGAPTDAVLRLKDAKGKQLATADDTGIQDAVIDYTFPADGEYVLTVEDLHGRGGPEFAYRIQVDESSTGFSLQADADHLNVSAGGTGLITVTATRNGYNGPIAISGDNLPQGVTSTPTVIGPGQTSVVLTLQGTPEAKTGVGHPVQIVGTATIGGKEFRTTASTSEALKALFNGMPWPPAMLTDDLLLGIAPAPKFALRTEPQQIVFGRNLSTKVKVIAERSEGFDAAITLAVNPAKNGLPANITAAVKPIPQGKNEIEVVFSATDKAPLGEFTAVLTGTGKKGNETGTESVPGIGLRLTAPYTLSVEPAEFKLAKGGKSKVKVKLDRNPAFNGEVTVKFQNLPAGVTAAEAKLPADQNEVEVELSATDAAAAGMTDKVTVKGDSKVGNAAFAETSPTLKLTVE